jgi:hypothetical protein
MITNLRQQRSARTAATQTSIRSRPSGVPGIRDAAVESTRDARDELSLEVPMLEAEVLELRLLLAEVTANRDELRQEMDDLRRDRGNWRKLAEPAKAAKAESGPRTWFCGRVSAGA